MNVHVSVRNFGPIAAAEVDLRPLTVLVGESNTGKTYLAALIYALYRNFEGTPQFPWADSFAFYYSSVYRILDPNSQDEKEELEKQAFEPLKKLNTPEYC